jgi:DNA-binding NarL/FixJ family response regulator
MIRVILADDQHMVRAGLKLILSAEADIEVVAEAADGQQAVAAAKRLVPDVVLMDVRMPRLDGISATRQILTSVPGVRVVVLTTFDVDEHVYDALRAGASGFLLKSAPPEDLVRAIRVTSDGNGLIDPAVTQRVVTEFVRSTRPAAPPAAHRTLTEREREILLHVARGDTNAEIAAELYVSEATVKTHVARILAKLGLRDRVQVVVFAYEHGLARPGTGGR